MIKRLSSFSFQNDFIMTVQTIAPLNNPVILSDLHLRQDRPKTLMGFIRFLEHQALQYEELVILGDLFDEWLGEESSDDGIVDTVISHLRVFVTSGRRVLIMPGDRDFMIDREFAKACNAEFIPDNTVLTIKDVPVLVAHGDRWCTQEQSHQHFRQIVARPAWRDAFHRETDLSLRRELIKEAKERAINLAQGQPISPAQNMRIVEHAVESDALDANVQCVIHGHIMRPGPHISTHYERWSLPHWDLEDPERLRCGFITFRSPGRPQIQII